MMGAIIVVLLIGAGLIYLEVTGDTEEVLSGCLAGLVGFGGVIFISMLLGAINPIIGIIAFIMMCRTFNE